MKILYFGIDNTFIKSLDLELLDSGFLLYSVSNLEELEKEMNSCALVLIDYDHEKEIIEKAVEKIKDIEMKRAGKNIPLIYISNKDNFDEKLRAFHMGADEYVDKYELKSLKLKINSFLRPDLIWKGLNTLLVEDDRISAKFISHVLTSKGANVTLFLDSVEAFEYLKAGNVVDLILTDHMMPNLTGVSFVKKIRKELGIRAVPIVFISSEQDKVEILEFYKAGGNDYIGKPLIKEELYVKVNQLLENTIKTSILKKQIEELEKLSRLKDQFLAVCSHDLRTPLNTILGLSNIIGEEEDIKDIKEYGDQIEKSARELLEMVNELLDFSDIELKKSTVKLTSVNVVEILKNALRNISSINTKHLRLSIVSDFDEVLINGNKGMLQRAFSNVMSNSYKFTAEGGEIKCTVLKDNDFVNVIVSDSGIGMSSEELSHLFDTVPTTGREGLKGEKSTGLGTKIVKNIMEKHGAETNVTSIEGVGTTFTFRFQMSSNEKGT
ncbi:response regulator [Bacteriovorax sp. Seq25_V]|uniref:sensor histidine kinase n=1 Tax=Bacteriovorax sp. Seq25_V TaxID=1201288 RepID=UPI00038A44F2|nr:response regulator [Bacteriovorax sp. Seq25_V]EQC44003.1 response regulator receiver domain protein [Bacteriovorax sp. Seq25_V]